MPPEIDTPRKKRRNAKAEVNDPYAEGADAAMAGIRLDANPYGSQSKDHHMWSIGWHDTMSDTTVE